MTTLILGVCFCAHAHFWGRHAEGWHWYEPLIQEQKPQTQTPDRSPQSSPISSAHQLQAFKKKVEDLKAVAVMSPTTQNVRAYMEIQKKLLEKSSRFAQRWLEVVALNPELDYTLRHPTSHAGRPIALEERKRDIEARILGLSKTHGLFFFFSSSCAYCRAFAPIVKRFASLYKWGVLAVSMDGSRLQEFPKAQNDNGTSRTLGLKALPALLAVEPKSGQVIPLSYGLSTLDQIEERVRILLLGRRS